MKIVRSATPEFQTEMQNLVSRRFHVMDQYSSQVDEIIARFRVERAHLLLESNRKFDGVELSEESLLVPEDLIRNSHRSVSAEIKKSIDHALERMDRFQDEFKISSFETEYESGVLFGAEVRPCERVGIYVPGGRVNHFLTLLLCAVPARKAGVKSIVVATPPRAQYPGVFVDPAFLYAAKIMEISEILLAGGPGALAALAFGFPRFRSVEKIVGSGSKLTSVAKMRLAGYVGIDGFEGPSETAFICDRTNSIDQVAADIVGRAGRNPEGSLFVFHQDGSWFEDLVLALGKKTSEIPDPQWRDAVRLCLERNALFFQIKNLDEAIQICNQLAPGVVSLLVNDAEKWMPRIQACGSLLLGPYTSSVAMDILGAPSGLVETMGASSYSISLSPVTFLRRFSVFEFSQDALDRLQKETECLARQEGHPGAEMSYKSRLTDKSS